MTKIPEMIPVTELHQDTAGVIQRLPKQKQPLVITQEGHSAAVILSIEAYEQANKERELLLLLARGEQEIAAGMGYDLDDILVEAAPLIIPND